MSENPGPYMYVLSQWQLDDLRHEWLISDEGDAAVTAAAAAYHKTECLYGIELAALREAVEDAQTLLRDDGLVWSALVLIDAALAAANSQPGSNLEQPGSSTPDPETPCPTCGAQGDETCRYVAADTPELAGLTRVGAGDHPARHPGGVKWNA